MASGTSTLKTALDAAQTTRNGAVSLAAVQQTRRVYRDTVVGLANHSNGEYFDLMPLGIAGARVVPEECRLRFAGTGTVDFKAQLKKVDKDGANAVSLSAATATIAALTAAITLAAPDGTPPVELLATDRLRLYLSTGASAVTIPTTATIHIEVAYDVTGR